MAIELLIEIEAPIILQAVQNGFTLGLGMPKGGNTRQVLTKASGDDYDNEWTDQEGASTVIVNSAAHAVLVTDRRLHVTYTATGTCTITIPTALMTTELDLLIKDGGLNATTNNITIVGEGGETIDGDSSWIINGDGDWLKLYSDGVNLFIHG
jgi:hypothetical protein